METIDNISPSKAFSDVAKRSAKKYSKEKKHKASDIVKKQRRLKKYSRNNNSVQAKKAYSRHDGGLTPDDVDDDISPEHLEGLKNGFYETKVVVTPEEAKAIEQQTREQADCEEWIGERRKRLTASMVGGVAKMRSTTKKSKRVENLLYTRFRGNAATRYGAVMEDTAKHEYQTYQQQHGHPGLKVDNCGLFVSLNHPWLAATPDGIVNDPSDATQPLGLLEIKKPIFSTKSNFDRGIRKEDILFRKKRQVT